MQHFNIAPLLILLLPFVLAGLKRKGRAQRAGQPPRPGDDDRTRQVREEVQRRIAQRRAAQPAPKPPAPEAEDRPWWDLPGPLTDVRPLDPFGGRRRAAEAPEPPMVPSEPSAVLPLSESKTSAGKAPPPPAPAEAAIAVISFPAAAAPPPAALQPIAHPWLAELRDRSDLRKIVVLREVLGPPLALR